MSRVSRVSLPVSGVRLSLWRAVTAFRVASLVVCLFLVVHWQPIYEQPAVALAAGAVMTLGTAVLGVLAWTGRAHRPAVVLVDVALTALLTVLSAPAQTAAQQHGGMVTLTTIWAAGPAIEAAFVAGPVAGVLAAGVQYASAYVVRGGYSGETLYSAIVLVLVGAVAGLVARYSVRAEDELRVAAAAQAALAERERLARSIHDGVLQVLGLVARTGRDETGRWHDIATAAAEQEALLRGLITSRPPADGATRDGATRDVADDLRGLRRAGVTVSAPAEPVLVAGPVATEVRDAVCAALDNVAVHAGSDAHSWVLLEAMADSISITVRDDGAGFVPARLDEAAGQGRIGVARSIRGRIEELGGCCTITSAPGHGTEIEMRVPLP